MGYGRCRAGCGSRCRRVFAVLVFERAFNDVDFLAAKVLVLLELSARRPAHERNMLCAVTVQRQHAQPGHQPLGPLGLAAIDHNALGIRVLKLPQIDEDRGAVVGARGV